MFNRTEINQTEKKAWDVLADPAAPEKKWQAACKVVEGKEYQISPLPKPFGLLFSLILSYSSAAGASMVFLGLFASLQFFFPYVNYFESIPWASAFLFYYVFNSIFTYQKLSWKGGKSWDITQGGLMLILASMPMVLTAAFTPSLMADPSTLLYSGMFFGVTALGYKLGNCLTQKSVKNLSGTIGPARVYEPMKYGLSAGILILSVVYFFPYPTIAALPLLFGLLALTVGGTSYLAVRRSKSYRKETSLNIGSFIWHPMLLVTAFAWTMGLSSFLLSGDLFQPASYPSFALFLGTTTLPLIMSYLFSYSGATLGTRQNQLELAKELNHPPEELLPKSEAFSQRPKIKEETA